ncbi:MlaD family protein [Campylobacter sp. 19-13652]|uniref:MlaD family protein n=1 Tax=Campylobacter sp. 19-13652 TaxID=2840180 RepID=UPI001C7516CE|nr:MlaD family protein [Campylobacter sp. 19-13652]BCX78984.1 hypothetical protein LBC_04460 [Campylobacter sp. 19-13652]
MDNKKTYLVVGIFLVICIGAAGLFMWFMQGGDSKGANYRSYYISTTALPTGLKDGSVVKFIGVDAGVVDKISFSDDKNATIEIELKIKKNLPIRHDSMAVVELQGISGIAYLNITRGSPTSPLFAPDEHAIIKLEESLLSKFGERAKSLSDQASSVLTSVEYILDEKNRQSLATLLSSLASISSEIEKSGGAKSLGQTIKRLDEFSKIALNEKNANAFNEAINRLNQSANALKIISSKELPSTLNEIKALAAKLGSNEYNLQKILYPSLSEFDDTLASFKRTLKQVDAALDRLEDNPYEFFFKDIKE